MIRRVGMRRVPRAAGSLFLFLLLLTAGTSDAKICGGVVACACGDTLRGATTLTGDLGVCPGVGLRLLSGATLDCAGFTVTGADLPGAWYGLMPDQATGATVRNCRVTGFRRGIRIRGGSGNRVERNTVFGNRYGIELADGASRNVVRGNEVTDHRDEGIHLGTASNDNEIASNVVLRSKRESLYLLRSHRNVVSDNSFLDGKKAAIYVKHSSDNAFARNVTTRGATHVRGDSTGNRFLGNALRGEGYFFQAFEEFAADGSSLGWSFPHDNAVEGGSVSRSKVCFRFAGAYDNTVSGVVPDCKTLVTRTSLGGQEAIGDTVTP